METIETLKKDIGTEYVRIKELVKQDETDFTDFELSIKGKKVNIQLCYAHITYYLRKIKEMDNKSLERWLK